MWPLNPGIVSVPPIRGSTSEAVTTPTKGEIEMFRKKVEITRRDHDEGVMEALTNSQKVSKDPLEQFLWLKIIKTLQINRKLSIWLA